jgi:hypothetical protein
VYGNGSVSSIGLWCYFVAYVAYVRYQLDKLVNGIVN